MELQPHQQRVVTEKAELDEKLAKLDAFGRTTLFASLPAEEQGRLNRQHSLMEQYSAVLGERIAAFTAFQRMEKHTMETDTDILDELKLMADIWDDNEDQEMSVFFVRCIGEIRKLREALRPFAEHPEFQAPDEWAVTVIDRNEPTGAPVAGVTAGDFRRAVAAMSPNEKHQG